MGGSASKSLEEQEEAKIILTAACDAVQKAVIGIIKLEKVESENDVNATTEKIVELISNTAKATGAKVVEDKRSEKLRRALETRIGSRPGAESEKLATDLLFHKIFGNAAFTNPLDSGVGFGTGEKYSRTISYPLKRKRQLGEGAFGSVYSVVDENGSNFAVKEVPKLRIEEDVLRIEIKALGELSNKHVVQFYGFAGDEENFYVYMELMQGSLRDVIDRTGNPITEIKARRYTHDLLQGLIYLHQKNVIHRDIKCANVLLDASGTAKLAGMGMAKMFNHATLAEQPVERVAGTTPWMSPEVLSNQEGGRRSDVWSVGCTVFEMLKGHAPFMDGLPAVLCTMVLPRHILGLEHGKLVTDDKDFGPALKNFLVRIFVKLDERQSAEQVAEHAWLKQ